MDIFTFGQKYPTNIRKWTRLTPHPPPNPLPEHPVDVQPGASYYVDVPIVILYTLSYLVLGPSLWDLIHVQGEDDLSSCFPKCRLKTPQFPVLHRTLQRRNPRCAVQIVAAVDRCILYLLDQCYQCANQLVVVFLQSILCSIAVQDHVKYTTHICGPRRHLSRIRLQCSSQCRVHDPCYLVEK